MTAINSWGTLRLALGLVGMYFTVASIWAVKKFSYLSFGVYPSDIP